MWRTTGTMERNSTQCRGMQKETPCSGDVTPEGKGGAKPAMPAKPRDTSPQHSPQPVLEPSILRHGQDRQDRHRQVLQIQSGHRNCKNDSQGPTTETGRRFQPSRGFLGVPPRHSGDKGNQKSPCSHLLPPAQGSFSRVAHGEISPYGEAEAGQGTALHCSSHPWQPACQPGTLAQCSASTRSRGLGPSLAHSRLSRLPPASGTGPVWLQPRSPLASSRSSPCAAFAAAARGLQLGAPAPCSASAAPAQSPAGRWCWRWRWELGKGKGDGGAVGSSDRRGRVWVTKSKPRSPAHGRTPPTA